MSRDYKNYADYEDYDYDGPSFQKLKTGKKKKSKGHQSKHQREDYGFFEQEEDSGDKVLELMKSIAEQNKPKNNNTVEKNYVDQQVSSDPKNNTPKTFEFGPNTHELIGNKIDYDRVFNMEMVDSDYKGKKTFGIKFTFKGKNANTRTVWYNQRQRERDMVFAQEYKFWLSVRK